jgi:predicted ATPase with chaperone activity
MLAKRIPTIMLDLTLEEALEVTKIHSIIGSLPVKEGTLAFGLSERIKKYCVLDSEAKELLRMAMNELGLSARAYDKILLVSRTIADLAGLGYILAEHVSKGNTV